jgi:RND family efflux transporter MFP subunit
VLAKQILAGAAADSVLAPQVASLTKEVMKAMLLSKLKTQAILVVTVLGLILAGGGWAIHLYAVSPEGPNRRNADEPQTKKADERVKPKPPPLAAPKTVTVVQPLHSMAAPYADYPGRLVALQQVDVQPTVSGRLEKVLFQAGADVKKGELLFEIESTSYQLALEKAETEVERVGTQISQKERDLKQARDLVNKGYGSEKEISKAESEVREAEANHRQAQLERQRAKLNMAATKITAPLDGRISEPRVYPGNQVFAGGDKTIVLATITVLDPIGLSFDMDERSYLRYQHLLREKEVKGTGSPLSMGISDESGFPREGTLVGFGDRIDEQFGTIRARAKLANPDGLLLPGMYARVRVTFGRPRTVIEVPKKAVWADEKTHELYALVVNDRKQVERRAVQREPLEVAKGSGNFPPVTDLDQHTNKAFIKEGLSPEDWVIISDIHGLQPGDEVEVKRVKDTLDSPGPKK